MLRLTREAGLLAPTPQVRKRAARLHEGTIIVSVPDTLWATAATEAWSRQEGRCVVFVLVDHASNEAWYDAARRIGCFAAADLLREVCGERFGSVERAVASGLALRYDGGSCFRSGHYQTEIDHLGVARSPAFPYEPETNGVAEKALQTLEEQLLWIEHFDTLNELRTAVRAFGRTYNQHWLVERYGYRTPSEARDHLRAQATTTAQPACPPQSPANRGRRTALLKKPRATVEEIIERLLVRGRELRQQAEQLTTDDEYTNWVYATERWQNYGRGALHGADASDTEGDEFYSAATQGSSDRSGRREMRTSRIAAKLSTAV